MGSPAKPDSDSPGLIRGMSLWSATALNMIDMIGVGPFITMPLVLAAMGGPQALLGWVVGALFAVCDGLGTAELGAALPGSGGSYTYLREIYGPHKWGRLISFLFIWQVSFSAPLSIATGCLGLAGYAAYYWPGLQHVYAAHSAALPIPGAGALQVSWVVTRGTALAIAVCGFSVFLLYRRITVIGRLSKILWFGVMGTIGWIIFAGLTHFNATQAFDFPPGAFTLSREFFTGLGGALLVATYDYWGYYNVCFLGDEIKDPTRNIPRALLLSIGLVACLYLMMNLCILAVVPWREMLQAGRNNSGLYVVSLFMQRVYGAWAARLVTGLVIVAAFASVFSLMLGYSRVPYAAARDGNYFRVFAKLHPEHRFPHISLLALGVVAAAFCFLQLKDAIAALVVIRIVVQFIVQAAGVIVLRVRRPDLPRPFRMWFYPLPALIAIAGFLFILFNRENALREVRYAVVILLVGILIYMIRAWRGREWPFAATR
ncbi:MAG TPA: APC family permease [Candidatus Aquilonibacter sp.]|jgi:APA family basic amino acid/polyamine antiporter|nr:APC family permease [Candidatus Aquilonibacter sp.]